MVGDADRDVHGVGVSGGGGRDGVVARLQEWEDVQKIHLMKRRKREEGRGVFGERC